MRVSPTPALHGVLVQAFFKPVPRSLYPSQFPNRILLHFWGSPEELR